MWARDVSRGGSVHPKKYKSLEGGRVQLDEVLPAGKQFSCMVIPSPKQIPGNVLDVGLDAI